ncbi:MAG: phospho-N-acetylmuramoyl-pentapeptide-transferase [Clostridiales bacterium]|jgi:phospho-N-acetylmuramoyl-pentapeptide-transferase|nr:phospho-N-acetylmuramoyl-pentapeptide-transferase [Clostridiales bacterium]
MHDTLIYSILLSFGVSLLLGPLVIPLLKRLKFGQMVRDDGPQTHLSKAGTPTMGGVIILLAAVLTCLVLFSGPVEYLLLAVLIMLGYGLVGFLDDFIKVLRRRSMGLRAYQKIIGQLGLAVVVALFAYNDPNIGSKLIVPFAGVEWDLGVWYVPFTVFAVLGVVNGVNLTDGLDGLASGVTLLNALTFGLLYIVFIGSAAGRTLYADNLKNMLVFAGAVTGACLGFLRYNTYPARVFMGDTGALALGGALAVMAIMVRMTLIIPLIGLMFVLSVVSVVLQVGSYKLRKKRVFKMAPLHHHFELKGNPETKVVAIYMIVTAITCLIALLSV